MKYLKSYKLFESRERLEEYVLKNRDDSNKRLSKKEIEEILDYIDDIFIHLKDEGFDLDYGGQFLSISIRKLSSAGFNMVRSHVYNIDDISDTVQMLHGYIVSMGLPLEKMIITTRDMLSGKNSEHKIRSIDDYPKKGINDIKDFLKKYYQSDEVDNVVNFEMKFTEPGVNHNNP